MTVAWHANYVLKISGSTVNYANENRRISEKVAAAAGDTYRLSCSANWNNALYVIYAADNSVLACRQAPNNAAGEVLTDFAVTMPENTAYFRVAANLEIQPESYAVAQYTTRIAAKAPVLTVAAVRTCWIFAGGDLYPKPAKRHPESGKCTADHRLTIQRGFFNKKSKGC